MDKDFEQVLAELDQAALAVIDHPECSLEIGVPICEFMAKLHMGMAGRAMIAVDILRANAIKKFGNQAAVELDKLDRPVTKLD